MAKWIEPLGIQLYCPHQRYATAINLNIVWSLDKYDSILVDCWTRFLFCLFCLFCLFGVNGPIREFFTHVETSPLPVQIMTYARHSWTLSSEGSLACHTYCDRGHPFITVISKDRDTQTYCRAFSSGTVTTCFYDLGISWLGFFQSY